ncbi:MAG TPA: HEAT repeat domain-containing protein [Thermoanaerobaculia bacterium]
MTIRITHDISEKTLAQAVAGNEPDLPRGRAISQVPFSKIPDRAGVLRKILDNEEDGLTARRLAASALWRLNTPEAREALLAAANETGDPRLQSNVVKLLGRVGDRRALAAIEKIRDRGRAFLPEQAAFAASLISYRLGLPGNDLPVPRQFEPLPPTDHRRIEFVPAPPEEVALFRQSLEEQPYDIPVSNDGMLQIRCERTRWILAFTETFAAADSVAPLQKQKSVVALLAGKNSEDGRYAVAFLFFASPARGSKQVHLLGHRTTGEQAWAGTIEPGEQGGVRFSLRTAGRLGIVPIELDGVWRGGGKLETTTALSATHVTEKQRATPIDPPART